MKQKVVFCFYTNDHEVNLGIGFMSTALRYGGVDTELVIYRDFPGSQVDTPGSVVAQILEKDPSIIAFSAMTLNWRRVKELIPPLRKDFDGLIIVGGYHAILEPEEVLSFPGVDGVCVGEGELPIISTVAAYKGGNRENMPNIEGMVFKNQEGQADAFKKCWIVKNLEDYPYMEYDIFDSVSKEGLRHMHIGVLSPAGFVSLPVITGRGCPYKCTYCCNSAFMKRYGNLKEFLRRYSVESAISNIERIVERYKPQFIEFFDETFIRNKPWVKNFCSRYKEEIGYPYMIMARIDLIDEEIVYAMAESGLKLVLFGVESGDEEYRKKFLNRKISDKTIIEGAKLLRKYGILIGTFNMFGMPFETKEMIEKTFALNAAIQPDAAYATIFQPLPGTELARIAKEHNMAAPPPDGMWDLHSPSLDTPELPSSYVVKKLTEFREIYANTQVVENYYSRLRKLAKPAE